MDKRFKGVYAVAVTPFKKDGSFDFKAAKAHLDYLIESGVHGICVLGATGEYLSVTNEEHMEYVREIVPYICNRISVIVGATRERPDDAIELILNAKQAGAHAAMVLPPYYCHPTQEEIFAHYAYISAATEFPLMVYNNPGSAGVEIERETERRLFALKNVALIKESSGSIQSLTDILTDVPEHISAFCGCDSLAFESFAVGGHGWISMLANVAPKDCVAMFHAVYEEKDIVKGFEIYKRLLPALHHLENFPSPVQSLKHVITSRGGTGGYVRKPRLELTEEQKAFVLTAMRADKIN